MQIVFAILMIGTSLTVLSQADLSKQTVVSHPPFTLTISYDQQNPNIENTADQIVKGNQWVSFRVRKTNITDHEILKRSQAGHYYGYDFAVRDSSGNPVGPKHPNELMLKSGDKGGIVSGVNEVLRPGESEIDFFPVASRFNMTKPGVYTIQVSAHVSDDPTSDVVKSNILTVTVEPEPEHPEPK